MPIAIGVDIGGSHISSAAVNTSTNQTIPGTYFNSSVNSKATKEIIFEGWGNVLNQSLNAIGNAHVLGIGIAMPGPFQYNIGIGLFEGNDKFEALYGVSVVSELPKYLNRKDLSLRFINDASSFGIGSSLVEGQGKSGRNLAITLGTGFGAAFLENQVPVTQEENVPKGGCLWDKIFKDGIADDYFSTRWFLSKHEEVSGQNGITEVKEIIEAENNYSERIFNEFALNISEFMLPHLKKFETDQLIIGGSIAKSHDLFLPTVLQKWKEKEYNIPVTIVDNTEEASIVGSSSLFNEVFWEKVRYSLPDM